MNNEELNLSEEDIQKRFDMYNEKVKQIGEHYNVPVRKAKRMLKSIIQKNIKQFQKNHFKNKDLPKIYINPDEVLNEIRKEDDK